MRKEQPDNDQLKGWWQQALSGSSHAYGQIHAALFAGLYNYGWKLLTDEALTNDALQELFIRIWNKKDSIGELEKVKAYFFTALRRQILNQLRDLKLRQLRISLYEQPDFEFSQEEIVIKKEEDLALKEKILQMLNNLPARQKEVIYLHYFEAMSLQQISEILDINYQSVLNIRQRALVKMRSLNLLQVFLTFCACYYLYPRDFF